MRKIFKLVLLSSILLSVFSSAWGASMVRDFNVSDYKGKWVIISYWATWCEFCMHEIPELNAFYKDHGNQVAMFGVNFQDSGDLKQNIRQSGVKFPTLMDDPKANWGIRRISGLPTTLIIGPDGQLRRVLEGPQTEDRLERAVGL